MLLVSVENEPVPPSKSFSSRGSEEVEWEEEVPVVVGASLEPPVPQPTIPSVMEVARNHARRIARVQISRHQILATL